MHEPGLVQLLFVNVCILTTFAFLGSLTISTRSVKEAPHFAVVRAVIAVLTSLVLMQFPAVIETNLRIDLRTVPIAMIALELGMPWGLAAALPVALYRLMLGSDAAGIVGAVNCFAVALIAGGLGRWLRSSGLSGVPIVRFAVPVVTFALTGWFRFAVPEEEGLLERVYLLVLGGKLIGFGLVNLVLQARLETVRTVRQFESLSHTDPLTGLGNRRAFEEAELTLKPGDHLLAIDLDGFKAVNDAHGHARGDEVLRATARALRLTVRPSDGLYRVGGEEFVVLLIDCTGADALEVAGRIRTAVTRETTLRLGIAMTISGGLVTLSEALRSKEGLHEADRRLYAAKVAGRNRIMAAGVVA